MYSADVEIIVDPSDAIRRVALLQTKLQVAGLQMFMYGKVVPWLQHRAMQRFASEGDDASGRWTPLSRATQMIRARKGFPPAHPINVRTGDMKNFLDTALGQMRGSAGYISLNWPGNQGRSSDIDTKIRTAQGLTPGTPARPVLGLAQQDDAHVMTELLVYLLSR